MNRDKAAVLIVDDEIYIQEILGATLRDACFSCVTADNADRALDELASRNFDMVFTDVLLPGKSGMDLLGEVKEKYPHVLVIMITAVDKASTAVETIRQGAFDYIIKPFDLDEVLAVAERALSRKRLEESSREYQKYLELMAEERAAETRRLFYLMTQLLVNLLELKAPFSTGHALRVAEMSRHVARELRMTEDGARKVYLAALLHDIGLITAEDVLLTKPGSLSAEEQQVLRERMSLAESVLKPILDDEEVLKYIRHKHERFDGSGYPDGLKGRVIPLGSRIISVTEAFDAMTRDRPYRQALGSEDALAELQRCSDSQFDGQVVGVFLDMYERTFRHSDLASLDRNDLSAEDF